MKNKVIITNEIKEREKAYAIRRTVFIDEQHIPADIEIDEYDEHVDTKYVLLMHHDSHAVGTARFRPYGNGILKIERVAVLSEERGQGAGRMIMEAIEAEAKKTGYHAMKLGAQLHAKAFYESLGYQAEGANYLDAGIGHVDMFKKL